MFVMKLIPLSLDKNHINHICLCFVSMLIDGMVSCMLLLIVVVNKLFILFLFITRRKVETSYNVFSKFD